MENNGVYEDAVREGNEPSFYEEELEQAAIQLVNESRQSNISNPNAFDSFKGKEQTTQQLIHILEMAKDKNQFTGIILYGMSKDKVKLAKAAAAYLGITHYDLITDDEEEDQLDKETAQAFSRKFVRYLAEDIKKHDKVVVYWVDTTDDLCKEMEHWEKEIEDEFDKTILTMGNVIAINILESPELITTNCYSPADYEFKIRVDDEGDL